MTNEIGLLIRFFLFSFFGSIIDQWDSGSMSNACGRRVCLSSTQGQKVSMHSVFYDEGVVDVI